MLERRVFAWSLGTCGEPASARLLFAFGIPLLCVGCSVGPTPITQTETRLDPVVSAYKNVTVGAKEDQHHVWHSGWTGNLRVRLDLTGRHRGLCWEWVLLIYPAVRDAAANSGFGVGTVSKHVGSLSEHHAVIVFDQTLFPAAEAPLGEFVGVPLPFAHGPVWVLDPWRTGQTDVFCLGDWLQGVDSQDVRVSILRLPSPPD